jgi:hypothetical protein
MGARDRKKRLQYHGFELYGIKAIQIYAKTRVYANCGGVSEKEKSSSAPSPPKRCPVR